MKTIPMIFNTEMMKALLDGRKTVTRRPVSKEINEACRFVGSSDDTDEKYEFLGLDYCQWKNENGKEQKEEYCVYCTEYPDEGVIPIGQGVARVGDLIWVRETFQGPLFDADKELEFIENRDKFYTNEYCVYAASDSKPEFYDVDTEGTVCRWKPSIHMPRWANRLTLRVTDVRIERVQEITPEQAIKEGINHDSMSCPKAEFGQLWNKLYSNWTDNPCVWVIEFEVIHQNVDALYKQD